MNTIAEVAVADSLRLYQQFETLRPVFISGVRRSGTTLLQRMLDGHPRLLVYPLEDCIVRDSFFENRMFQLHQLQELLDSRNAEAVLSYMISNPKLALALESRIDGSDAELVARHLHLGRSQVLQNRVDRDLFRHLFLGIFRALEARQWGVADAVRVWMFSFFRACGIADMSSYVGWVTKCPEEGRCFPLYMSLFPDCRVIHVMRDPRGFYASESRRGGTQPPVPSVTAIRAGIQLWAAGLANVREAPHVGPGRLTCIRYEDLLASPEHTLRTIADSIEIDYSDSLLEPTYGGQPWNANTSFEAELPQKGLVAGRADHWRGVLTDDERNLIERALYKDMVAFGYMSRVRGAYWWFRLQVIGMIRTRAWRMMVPVRLLLARARRR